MKRLRALFVGCSPPLRRPTPLLYPFVLILQQPFSTKNVSSIYGIRGYSARALPFEKTVQQKRGKWLRSEENGCKYASRAHTSTGALSIYHTPSRDISYAIIPPLVPCQISIHVYRGIRRRRSCYQFWKVHSLHRREVQVEVWYVCRCNLQNSLVRGST